MNTLFLSKYLTNLKRYHTKIFRRVCENIRTWMYVKVLLFDFATTNYGINKKYPIYRPHHTSFILQQLTQNSSNKLLYAHTIPSSHLALQSVV